MNRAYSLLTIKALDAESRTFTGIATAPTVDRMGDIVESTGAQYRLPIPLLLHHNSQLPVGEVTAADVKPNGITVRGRIASLDEPGTLKSRVDEAWDSIKAGLIRGLSIGFRPRNNGAEPMKSGGTRFTLWEWLELSLVVVPANADATITTVKHFAQQGARGVPLIKARPGAVQLITTRRLR
jgi:HK97 family phage prohead protease